MNPLELIQADFVAGLPTASDVLNGKVTISTRDVVLILRRDGEWKACGPFPTKDVEWHRLPRDARVYVGDP